MRISIHKALKFSRWLFQPQVLTVTVSAVTFGVVNLLGYWDVEDLFVSGSSLGARFGLSGSEIDRTNDLVYSLWGVPVLDFGVIGGYRLPYQGTINTGPLWILRNLLPAEILLTLTLLFSMILAALAFGFFWRVAIQAHSNHRSWSVLLCFTCWVSLQFPLFEYLLQQDWYTAAIVNQGFISVFSSLLTIMVLPRSSFMTQINFKRSLRMLLIGSYFLILGHTGLLAVYGPTLFVLAVFVLVQSRRSAHLFAVSWKRLRLEIVIVIVVIIRFCAMSFELLFELRQRNTIGTDSWWAQPIRSYPDLRHFVGQLIGTEFRPWLAISNSSWLADFNISEFSRLPHTSASVMFIILMHVLLKRHSKSKIALVPLLALWIVNFLMMLRIVPNFARVPVDYLYRDVLLALTMAAVGIVIGSYVHAKRTLPRSLFTVLMLTAVIVTSFSVSIGNPALQWHRWSTSPYSLSSSLRQSTGWIKALEIRADDYGKVLAVIDPVFLSRWKALGSDETDWKGLRGFFQLRQAGVKTLEGSPKIRDATAYTGATQSLKQSLEAPNATFCDPVLFSLLGVSKIVMSSWNKDRCVRQLSNREFSAENHWKLTSLKPLVDSELWVADFSSDSAVSLRSKQLSSKVRCGLLTNPECGKDLHLAFDSNWITSELQCKLPCVLRLTRIGHSHVGEFPLITPLNTGNSLTVYNGSGTRVRHFSINGLIAIPVDSYQQSELTVRVSPDIRMWLQVANAYAQYLVVAYVLVVVTIRSLRARRTSQ